MILATVVLILSVSLSTDAFPSLPSWMPPPNSCESTHTPKPYDGQPPNLPSLPTQFSMLVEANIFNKGYTVQIEEHYDRVKGQASVARTFNRSSTATIYNFVDGERYDLYENGTCIAGPAKVDFIGMVTKDRNNRPAMASLGEMLRFGKFFNETYVGVEYVRNIKVNHWTSCQEWSTFGTKFQIDWYFSHPDYLPASGGKEIPVRAVVNGTSGGMRPGKTSHRFEHVYDFFSVRVGPPKDKTVFQIPPGVVCKGRKDQKAMPVLPDVFEMSAEVMVPNRAFPPRQQFFRYDYKHELIETWHQMAVPEGFKMSDKSHMDPKNKVNAQVDYDKMTLLSGSKVEDYKNRVVYYLNKKGLGCSAEAMPDNDVTSSMSHGYTLLQLGKGQKSQNHNFTYQGRSTYRQMPVDVWAKEEAGMRQAVIFLARPDMNLGQTGSRPTTTPSQSAPWSNYQNQNGQHRAKRSPHTNLQVLVGLSFSNQTRVKKGQMSGLFRKFFTDDEMQWDNAESRDFNGKQQDGSDKEKGQGKGKGDKPSSGMGDQMTWGMKMENKMDFYMGEKLVNVFHFTPMHSQTTNFQVSSCYEPSEQSNVMLVVNTPYMENVLPNMVAFNNEIRDALATKLKVSSIQISNLVTMPLKDTQNKIDSTSVSFKLLGKPPKISSKQLGIKELKHLLNKAISEGISFNVQYDDHSKSFMVNKGVKLVDYSQMWSGSDDEKMANPQNNPMEALSDLKNKNKDDDDKGINSGKAAVIAIGTFLAGIVLTLGAAYFFYKKRHPNEGIMSYKMESES